MAEAASGETTAGVVSVMVYDAVSLCGRLPRDNAVTPVTFLSLRELSAAYQQNKKIRLEIDSLAKRGVRASRFGIRVATEADVSHRSRCKLESTRSELNVLSRAKKLNAKGETRRALTILREACMRDETDASLWTQYGVLCTVHGKNKDALYALNHAIWLRERARQLPRAKVTRMLRACVDDPHRTAA